MAPVLLAGFPPGLAIWLSVRLEGHPVHEEHDLAKAAARARDGPGACLVVVDARDEPRRATDALRWSPEGARVPVVACIGRGAPEPQGMAAVLRHPLDRERLASTLRDLLASRSAPRGEPDLHDLARPILHERLERLERGLAAVLAGHHSRAELARDAPCAHALVGSLGALGYAQEARDALEVENLLKDAGRADLERVASLLRGLRVALSRPRPPPPPYKPRGRVLAVSADPTLLREWTVLGAALELLVVPCAPARGEETLATDPPDVLLVDDEDVPQRLVAAALASRPIVPVVLRTASTGVDLPGVRVVPRERSPAAALTVVRESLPAHVAALGTILLVDDDKVSLLHLRRLIEAIGGSPVTMDDPAEALGAISRLSPDAVIVDLQMEPVNGEEFTRLLRRDARWRHVPVLCVTGDDSPATRRRLLAAGIDDVLGKPPVVDVLRARLRSLLRAPLLTDPLSGVPTGAVLETLAPSLLDIARHEARPLSLVLVTLDAPAEGAPLARRLRDRLAREHFVARLSPRESAVLAYGLAPGEARALVAAHAPDGAALGVAGYPPYSSLDALLHEARRDSDTASVGAWSVTPNATATHVKRVDVAIVEEDGVVAGLVAKALEDAGLATRWFSDGAEAAAMLAGDQPPITARVVLTEVSLPGLDGFSLLRALRASPKPPRVILLTTRSSEPEVLQAFSMGAFDHVAKPFSLPVLLHRVRRALGA